MSRFWSELAYGLSPYVPGEQPQIPGLVKLNTNDGPFGPSPKASEAIRAAAADPLRLYPDPQATRLREGSNGTYYCFALRNGSTKLNTVSAISALRNIVRETSRHTGPVPVARR